MEDYLGTGLIGHVQNVADRDDEVFIEALQQLMIKHEVNSVRVGWARFDILGDRFKGGLEVRDMVTFDSDTELRVLLKVYFRGLALNWSDDFICLIDDDVDLTRLSKFLMSKGKEGGVE